MRFPGGDKSVLSGLMNGADEIKGRAAVVRTSVGKGEVVMFTTNPVWRWQNIGEFRMMFNTILNYKNLDTHAPPSQITRRPLLLSRQPAISCANSGHRALNSSLPPVS